MIGWKFHIALDYLFSRGPARILNENLVLEKFGAVPGLEHTLAVAWNSIKDRISKGKICSFKLDAPYLGPLCSGTVEGVVDSSWTESDSCTIPRAGVIDRLKIYICFDPEKPTAESDFKRILSHELTHAYQYASRYTKVATGQKHMRDVGLRPSYNDIQKLCDDPDSKIRRVTGEILYQLFPEEQGAFTGELQAELEPKAATLGTADGAWKAIQETNMYKHLQWMKRQLVKISEFQKDTSKERFLQAVNLGYEAHYTTFEQALKRLSRDLAKYERKFQSIAGKICWELYNTKAIQEGRVRIQRNLVLEEL